MTTKTDITLDGDNQRITEKLVQREVAHCASQLIQEVSGLSVSYFEDNGAEDLIFGQVDYKSAVEDWLDENNSNKELQEAIDKGAYLTTDEEYKEFAYENNIEPYTDEIYEHWIVYDSLAEKLKEKGEVVKQILGLNIWGRTTTGQALNMDSVIFEIAKDMEILKGQKNDWSTEWRK